MGSLSQGLSLAVGQEGWEWVEVAWEGWRRWWLGKGSLLVSSAWLIWDCQRVVRVSVCSVLCLVGGCVRDAGVWVGGCCGCCPCVEVLMVCRGWAVGCLCGAAMGLDKPREHRAELPAMYDQAMIVSIMKINWPLLPKINVSVPNPHFNSTSSLEMHIIWL